MKKLLILCIAITSLFSCNSNTIIKKPENLISKNLMIEIITETYIAKAAGNRKNINGDKRLNYHHIVYQKYQLDSTTFNNSLNYYISRIDESEEIFKTVSDNLDQKMINLKKLLEEQKAKEEAEMEEKKTKEKETID